ncbi:uncharacterized protein KY384_009137 [Bacidia gigantensis]|uniref:uncharacterized protein n=1 Tax=Bacidia gigantensis TaxID=2732470 RepID=UPI001D037FAF|nr:uncharacterized protein KY384_009137 [Bacidia gigantensis]KAG8525493.1 hypothetical protein KY384_009137 [Bacidia gigantensis]
MSTSPEAGVPQSPFKSILNFRDVGSCINALTNTSLLKPSLLFRSARPDEASPEDVQKLTSTYGIHTIIDLRSNTEHIKQDEKFSQRRNAATLTTTEQKAANTVRMPGIKYADIDLNGGAFTKALLWKLKWRSLAKLLALMAAGYRTEAIRVLGTEVMAPRGLIGLGKDSLDHSKVNIRQVFGLLAITSNYPIMVHCTQGKDRTGLIVILVLLLLDASMPAIRADYVASEKELEPEKVERLKEIADVGLGEEFAGCPVGFVEEMQSYIDEKYGGIKPYLKACGVETQQQESVVHNLARMK